jgi:CRISPR-associated endonuclease Csn1
LSASDQKERIDHRHHAIDAIVVGTTERSTLQAVSRAIAQGSDKFGQSRISNLKPPFNEFRARIAKLIDRIVVSHKPDHGTGGRLHNDTAYGIAGPINDDDKSAVVYRKPLVDLKPTEIRKIRDTLIRERVTTVTDGKSDKAFTESLQKLHVETGIRRIRLEEKLSIIPISIRNDKPFKGYKGDANYCIEIIADEKGKWRGEIISRFVANQHPYQAFLADRTRFLKNSFSGLKLIMRLCKDDYIAVASAENREIFRVVKFSGSSICFAQHSEAGNLKSRNKSRDDPFKYLIKSPEKLRQLEARRVFVDPAGRVKDPGPICNNSS